ncbi:MAG: RidA family protein [candidate division KSB1 bacterium]|nr:RidA family protein [candidate division KSB1 bacterium]MDZ7319114.1 RidA family protein [candidate division KSB1 bacterium]MDZ7341513.1 RidA family protein [candidate division KSB1 bacterium]
MTIEEKIASLGFNLPPTPKPVAAYVPAIAVGDLVFSSGQLPLVSGELAAKGKVGREVTKEQAYAAARICALNALSAIKSVIGNLDRIERIVKVVGFVASAEGFTEQPHVINGASEFLKEIFGNQGSHARSAVGVAELPLGAAVEVELIAKIK